jgi:hypothetical protein
MPYKVRPIPKGHSHIFLDRLLKTMDLLGLLLMFVEFLITLVLIQLQQSVYVEEGATPGNDFVIPTLLNPKGVHLPKHFFNPLRVELVMDQALDSGLGFATDDLPELL